VSDAADASVLRARGLRKEYGKGEGLVRAVDGVDLDIGAGETVAVMGPSGCGKSTLLHLLGGLDRPSGGEVSLNGRRIDDIGEKALARMRRTDVGFVFQAFHLMEELTAIENVELRRCWPDARRGQPDGGRRSCWSRSGSPTGHVSCPRRCPVASGNGSRSPGR
jgi:ABC-type lipoprotein export system ATPase subunit